MIITAGFKATDSDGFVAKVSSIIVAEKGMSYGFHKKRMTSGPLKILFA